MLRQFPSYSFDRIFPTPNIMKAILPVLLLGTSLTLAPAQTDRVSSSGNARITEMGPHYRVWTRTVEEPTPYGEARRVEHRYVEMATGLNYLEDGVWKESKEEKGTRTIWREWRNVLQCRFACRGAWACRLDLC